MSIYHSTVAGDKRFGLLTAKMLATPRITTRIPDDITICQNDLPKDFSLVASLFKFPRIETPTTIIVIPRVTKPDDGEKSGQFRAM